MNIENLRSRALDSGVSAKDAHAVLDWPNDDLQSLFAVTTEIRELHHGLSVDACAIVNAKSGRCSEDCGFCAQSARYDSDIDTYELLSSDEIVAAAKKAESQGARHFGIVTAQRGLRKQDLPKIAEAIRRVADETTMVPGASLGFVEPEDMEALKAAGLHCFNHNLETSRRNFESVVSTHLFEERVATVKAAKEAGLLACSGGIFGIGETDDDRIDLAMTLKELEPSTVPLNFLYPVPGTPMAEQADLTPEICLKIIAMFRLVMPKVNLAVCGGREYNLQDRQEDLFKAGVSHLLVGHYLTTSGRDADDDKRLVAGQGLTIKGPQDQSAPHPATLPASDSHRQQNLPVMR